MKTMARFVRGLRGIPSNFPPPLFIKREGVFSPQISPPHPTKIFCSQKPQKKSLIGHPLNSKKPPKNPRNFSLPILFLKGFWGKKGGRQGGRAGGAGPDRATPEVRGGPRGPPPKPWLVAARPAPTRGARAPALHPPGGCPPSGVLGAPPPWGGPPA